VDPIQKLYTQRARIYERVFVDLLGWRRELETFFRRSRYLKPQCRVLDAGCGTGVVTRTLHEQARRERYAGLQFHAFDLTQRMLDIFKERIEGEKREGIELQRANVLEIETLPAHWRDYDLIASSALLEYLPPHETTRTVSNLLHLLRNEGTLLTFVIRNNFGTRALAARIWKTRLFQEHELRDLLHHDGFREVEFKRLPSGWSTSVIVAEGRGRQAGDIP
jgi:SAM-dependent methyltransferase